MINKVKLIVAIVSTLIIVASVICLFVYINKLNNKIADLNVTVSAQESQIGQLNCNIQSLEKNLESVYATMNITNEYIDSLKQIHDNETTSKQEIYNEIITNEESKDWYNTPIPDGILSIMSDDTDLMCENRDSNGN